MAQGAIQALSRSGVTLRLQLGEQPVPADRHGSSLKHLANEFDRAQVDIWGRVSSVGRDRHRPVIRLV